MRSRACAGWRSSRIRTTPECGLSLQAMEVAAKELNVALLRFDARGAADLDSAFAAMAKENVDALTVIRGRGPHRKLQEDRGAGGQAAPSLDQLRRVSPTRGDSSATARTFWRSIVAPLSSSTRSSKAPSPPTFRSSDRRRSNS